MKVLFTVPNFPPEFLGGTERVTRALGAALVRAGDEVVVVSGSDDALGEHAPAAREELDGMTVWRVRRRPDEEYGVDISRPRVRDVVADVVARERPDVAHVHHWATLSTSLVRAAAAAGVPTVASLHDVWTTCPRFFRRPPHGVTCPSGADRAACVGCIARNVTQFDEAWIEARVAERDAAIRAELGAATALTVPSASCRDRLAEFLPWSADAFEIVPHGLLEPLASADTAPRDERAADAPLRIGTFGNLVEEKGVALLVFAARGIPNVEVHLFGPFLVADFERYVHEKAAEWGVTVVCHGGYDSAAAGARHPARALDLAVFPSLCEESYGLVVEEALARGVPVVVSDRGALAERIGDGGVAVPVDEAGPLEVVLRRLAENRDELARLRAGITTQTATIDDAAARYRSIYARITS